MYMNTLKQRHLSKIPPHLHGESGFSLLESCGKVSSLLAGIALARGDEANESVCNSLSWLAMYLSSYVVFKTYINSHLQLAENSGNWSTSTRDLGDQAGLANENVKESLVDFDKLFNMVR